MKQGNTTTTTDYLDGFQYEDQVLCIYPAEEGHIQFNRDSNTNWFNYVFNYTDHLGNIRLSYTLDYNTNKIKILEENHYYPFGQKHRKYNNLLSDIQFNPSISNRGLTPIVKGKTYKYKYQGQERQDELGLNWDSFKWRNYDFAIGRFMNVDPLAEKYAPYSQYSFVTNNPIGNQEVDGRWWFSKNKKNNTLHYGANTVRVAGASQYAFKMSSVRAVYKKQTGWESYLPLIGNWLNGSAMAQKLEDPSMSLDKSDIASLFLGGYFKGTRKLVKAAGAYQGAAKTALKLSEEFTSMAQSIASSPELKESWVELAVMEHFDGATSDGGNTIGTLSNTKETDYTTIFRFSEDFVGELQGMYGNEFDSLKDTSGMSRESYIENKVQGHMQQMFESKKTEIMRKFDK